MFQPYSLNNNSITAQLGASNTVDPVAQKLFERALMTGRMKRLKSRLTGRSRQLLMLEASSSKSSNQHYAGTQTIPLHQIKGSVNKADDFDSEFYPRNERTENRWVWVATAMRNGTTLPPVELIRVDEIYYVVDGHHRISAARMMGYDFIDAVVTEW